ncbi:hypothetical protein FUA48_05845 [Flavobacterium alkalisoli]|uniref:Bacteriophage abortive infection AbiH family protein n=1 Tax=Flavobacterium alkalisoli TaxID=2602769 RepID=A0A5B9FSD6_9FLAO|nr:bacteriophage abortive infection AbiH family protein [Flavobacterium alkalisoli]QEE49119.1 hypothetical protein FUA48_05845 [Flavobacterium alkalisoli]
MYKNLYIIGNGFDLHHHIKSSYTDFKEYLCDSNPPLFEIAQNYLFTDDKMWNNFESSLALLNTEEIVDDCSNYLNEPGSDSWRDSDNHAYQYEVEQIIKSLTITLKEEFLKWILKIEIDDDVNNYKINIDKSSKFLNFNYTQLLQKAYNIPDTQINHIHNKAIDEDSNLILGHGRNPNEIDSLNKDLTEESFEFRVHEGNQILDKYFSENYKDTATVLYENQKFFHDLDEITKIYVFGHSMSDIDLPYFQEIVKYTNSENINWEVSYYKDHDVEDHNLFLNNLGIDHSKIFHFKLTDIQLNSNQILLFD